LGCRAIEPDVAALAALKGRDDKPFLLLVAHRRMAAACGLEFASSASRLADRFWPGPLTLVLPGGEARLPARLRGERGGIAVRWTSHAGMARLIERLGEPITSTSANLHGRSTAADCSEIVRWFGAAVEDGTLLVLDGGVLGSHPPSTIVDCTRGRPRVVREGAIARHDLREAVGSVD
ncbi:MAG: L-threonylcarbamoyladenylate synthase, partial [Gemmatimonadales bacterium]